MQLLWLPRQPTPFILPSRRARPDLYRLPHLELPRYCAISTRNVFSRNQAGAATILLTKPTGVIGTDVMYAGFYDGAIGTHTTLAGWTEVGYVASGNDNLTILRKVAGDSEPANYTFNGSNLADGFVVALIGVDNTTPEDATATTGTGNSVSVTAPTITTVTDNAWHLPVFLTLGTQSSLSLPSGYTNDVPTFGGGGDVMRVDHKAITPAGATGTAVSTGDVSGLWAAISVAVRPASIPLPYYERGTPRPQSRGGFGIFR